MSCGRDIADLLQSAAVSLCIAVCNAGKVFLLLDRNSGYGRTDALKKDPRPINNKQLMQEEIRNLIEVRVTTFCFLLYIHFIRFFASLFRIILVVVLYDKNYCIQSYVYL